MMSPITATTQAQCAEREREQAGRGAGAERKAAHSGQIVRGDEGDQRQQDQRHAAVKILLVLDAQETGG